MAKACKALANLSLAVPPGAPPACPASTVTVIYTIHYHNSLVVLEQDPGDLAPPAAAAKACTWSSRTAPSAAGTRRRRASSRRRCVQRRAAVVIIQSPSRQFGSPPRAFAATTSRSVPLAAAALSARLGSSSPRSRPGSRARRLATTRRSFTTGAPGAGRLRPSAADLPHVPRALVARRLQQVVQNQRRPRVQRQRPQAPEVSAQSAVRRRAVRTERDADGRRHPVRFVRGALRAGRVLGLEGPDRGEVVQRRARRPPQCRDPPQALVLVLRLQT